MSDAHISLAASTTRGTKPWRTTNLLATGQVVKAGAGNLYGGFVINTNAAARYIKFYNKATTPTEADTPAFVITAEPSKMTPIELPAKGVSFSAGISVRGTTGLADNDTGAPGASELNVSLFSY